ncbi:S8 family peptidase [Saccharothrix variisporea]|uniref:Subtilisin family serine protease n=1 Tax=Saccharothrix variisporea TaxID=543527 RepID=A0A495X4Z7_9PSEU|nr:S8 family serine peptidase [Saccharothrix variisporea]RKT69070.1 subtilisin family serine protease [Saccharothrix variisporea]
MTHWGTRSSLLAAVLVAGVVVVPAEAAADVGVMPSGPTVTLVTGDKVTLGGSDGVTVKAAQGRERIGFTSRTDVRGDLHVVPVDAVAGLAGGKLDPRLFNVSELVRAGYDDASVDRLPLIVDQPRAGANGRALPALGAAAVSVERNADFWATARDAEHIWLDGRVRVQLDKSVPQIGAPTAWAAGYTGAGTTVAVLDTGVDAKHPDLSDAVVGEQNFTTSDTAGDRVGHGTHVASTITGNGAQYKGVAPDTKLLNGKVLDDHGYGLESWIIAGMEWAAANNADVVNMSLGAPMPSDGTDPLSQAVNRITAETGTLFVIAAGNSGGQVGGPGAADAALTVGSVDKSDRLAPSSSRGRVDGVLKPDLTAPGVEITAAKAGGGYTTLSGTSMATPHVAGAAAVLAGQHPDWRPEQLKAALMGTAKPNGSLVEQGAGRVDLGTAATSTVFADAGSFSLGSVQWPHHDDQPITKTITYTNTGTEPVTLDLAADVTGPQGTLAPQGMFTFSPARLTVPAGGTATTTATVDTRVEAPDGVYSGAITATGSRTVRTVLTVTREVESYNVTVKALDHNGSPTDKYFAGFVDVNKRESHSSHDPSGTVVARVPKGEFYFTGFVQTEVGERQYRNTEFVEPSFVVTGDTEIVLDARQAKPVGFATDRPDAKVGSAKYRFRMKTAWGELSSTTFIQDYEAFTFKPTTTSARDRFSFTAEARMGAWNGKSFDGSPYLYHLRHTENGSVPQDLQWRFRDADLAKVRSEHAAATPGVVGYRENFLVVPLPGTLTEYYTPDEPWDGQFIEMVDPEHFEFVSVVDQTRPRSFPLGRTTTERWNTGVFGPAFPTGLDSPLYFAARIGDYTRFVLPLFTDNGRGRSGDASASGTTALLRDGTVIGETAAPGLGYFKVSPDRAQYTLRATADRSSYARLSTKVTADWTFTSEGDGTQDPRLLPLLAVRFTPTLDNTNAAPAGRPFRVPLYVQRNGTTDPGRVNTPVVEISYDDGATWLRAPVTRDRAQWTALAFHPADAKFVSLRSRVTDADGNAQSQTIIRAYALK